MKIAIPSMDDSGMEATISGHFGQAPFFTIVDAETGAVTAMVNPGHEGNQTPAQAIAAAGVGTVIGGGMGGRAIQLLGDLGIDVFLEAEGTVREVLEAYRQGRLPAASQAGACHHHPCPDH